MKTLSFSPVLGSAMRGRSDQCTLQAVGHGHDAVGKRPRRIAAGQPFVAAHYAQLTARALRSTISSPTYPGLREVRRSRADRAAAATPARRGAATIGALL